MKTYFMKAYMMHPKMNSYAADSIRHEYNVGLGLQVD